MSDDDRLWDVDFTAWALELAGEGGTNGTGLIRIGADVNMTCRNGDEDRECDPRYCCSQAAMT